VSTKSVFFKISLQWGLQPAAPPPPLTPGVHVWHILFGCVMVFRIKMKAASSSKTLLFAKLHAIIFLKTIAIYSCENLKSYNRFVFCMEHFVLTLITNCQAEFLNWSRRKSHDEKKSHTEELWNLYSFPSVFRLIKSGHIISLGTVKKCILNFSLMPWQKETIGHVWIWGCGLDASISE
jgi:hypothetical protein